MAGGLRDKEAARAIGLMRFGLYSNAHSVYAGGGVVELSGWAHALRSLGRVELLFASEVRAHDLSQVCGLDLSGVFIRYAKRRTWLGIDRINDKRKYDIAVRQTTHTPKPTVCRRAALLTNFPIQTEVSWRERQYIRTYSVIVANSGFTGSWIAKRWGRTAVVINPPVIHVATRPKMPGIVAVSRFTAGRRSKH